MRRNKNIPWLKTSLCGALALLSPRLGMRVPSRWKEVSATRCQLGFAPRLDHGTGLAAVGRFSGLGGSFGPRQN